MKKFLKIVLTVICWIGAIYFLFKSIEYFKNSDPWGLTFAFCSLPCGFIGTLLLIEAIIITKKLITKNKNIDG